jgi:SAM-dependent methyltransferase
MADVDRQEHWEKVYATKAPNAASWYAPHLDVSLAVLERTGAGPSTRIIDVGGGQSTLIDDLLARGYENVTVLDVSRTALEASRKRLGQRAERVRWIAGDITQVQLESAAFDVWHDRAVFHFLTDADDRAAYVREAADAVKHGGHLIVNTFGPQGPLKCSGLDVVRYDAESLGRVLRENFELVESSMQLHRTPFGTEQQFLTCCFRRK